MRITTPVEGFTGTVAGVTFADGVAETDDAGALAYFARHGYGIEDADAGPKPVDKMTVDELKAHAAEHSIDLGDATKKADILAAIHAAASQGD